MGADGTPNFNSLLGGIFRPCLNFFENLYCGIVPDPYGSFPYYLPDLVKTITTMYAMIIAALSGTSTSIYGQSLMHLCPGKPALLKPCEHKRVPSFFHYFCHLLCPSTLPVPYGYQRTSIGAHLKVSRRTGAACQTCWVQVEITDL